MDEPDLLLDDLGELFPIEDVGDFAFAMDDNSLFDNGSVNKSSKKRKTNPDSDAIAAVTEASLKAMNITDLDSKEAKKARRQIRNRLSAQFHRDRKNQYISSLEGQVAQQKQQIVLLQQEVDQLRAENQVLTERLSGRSSGRERSYTDSDGLTTPPTDSPLHPSSSSGDESSVSSGSAHAGVPALPGFAFSRPVLFLAMMCMACICCIPSLLSPSPNATLSSTYSILNPTFPAKPHAPDVSLPLSPSSTLPNRRLSAVPDNDESALVSNRPVSSLSPSINASAIPASAKQSSRKYLRHHPQRMPNGTEEALDVDHLKDLVPFDLPPGYLPPPSAAPLKTYSQIIMTHGLAVFDPNLRLAGEFPWPDERKAVVPSKFFSPPSAVHAAPSVKPGTPLLPSPPAADSSSSSESASSPWPTPLPFVSVTLPASSIKLGVSEEGSTEGTMEGIYRMFNITVGEAGGENGGENMTWPQREEVLVQIDCVILNAKLLVRSTSQ